MCVLTVTINVSARNADICCSQNTLLQLQCHISVFVYLFQDGNEAREDEALKFEQVRNARSCDVDYLSIVTGFNLCI